MMQSNRKTDYSSILYQASILMKLAVCLRHDTDEDNYFAYFPTDSAAAHAAFNKAYEM